MAISSLMLINNFQNFINIESDNITKGKIKGIAKLTESVTEYIDSQNSLQEKEIELLNEFIAKIEFANNKLSRDDENGVLFESIKKLNRVIEKKNHNPTLFETNLQVLKNLSQNLFFTNLLEVINGERTIPEEKEDAAIKKLVQLLNETLIPAIQSVKTPEDMKKLRKVLTEHCLGINVGLADKLSSQSAKELLSKYEQEANALWAVKRIQIGNMYTGLISNDTELPSDVFSSVDSKEKTVAKFDQFTSAFLEVSSHDLFSQEDKQAIYTAMHSIRGQFQAYCTNGEKNPIDPILKKMSRYLPGVVAPRKNPSIKMKSEVAVSTQSSNVRNIASKFESPVLEPSPQPTSSKKPNNVPNVKSEEERASAAFNNIKEGILNLDPHSSNFKTRIESIQTEIKKLQKLSSYQHLDFKYLESLLELISHGPMKLEASAEEGRLIELLSKKANPGSQSSQAVSLKYLANKSASQEALSDIIRTLKKTITKIGTTNSENVKSVETLIDSAKAIRIGLEDRVMQARFNKFANDNPNFKKLNLSNCFPALVNGFSAFTHDAKKEIVAAWEQMVADYDRQTSSSKRKFSELIGNYSYMNPLKDDSIKKAQSGFFKQELVPLINANQVNLTNVDLAKQKVKGKVAGIFKNRYKDNFDHQWLMRNAKNISIPHNQGDDKNGNLAGGVCYANSLYRCKLLIGNPTLKVITMGSSQETRFVQSVYGFSLDTLNYKNENAKFDDPATRIGLKQYGSTYYVPTTTTPNARFQDVVNEMVSYAETTGNTQFILIMNSSKGGSGHAINIQIDKKNNLYRMMDDNIGLVEYSSLSEFNKEVAEWLNSPGDYRNDLDLYSFRTYTL
jgi:hypothetical protein